MTITKLDWGTNYSYIECDAILIIPNSPNWNGITVKITKTLNSAGLTEVVTKKGTILELESYEFRKLTPLEKLL